jgi:hypothetical protein
VIVAVFVGDVVVEALGLAVLDVVDLLVVFLFGVLVLADAVVAADTSELIGDVVVEALGLAVLDVVDLLVVFSELLAPLVVEDAWTLSLTSFSP